MKKIVIIIILVVIVILAGIAISKNNAMKKKAAETPVEVLDKSTQNDSTTNIDSNLESIDVNSGADADFNSMDADIKAL